MARNSAVSRMLAALVGLGLFGATVYSVFMIDWSGEPPEEPEIVRPVKSMVVAQGAVETSLTFPGRVEATRSVDLAFDVPGQIVEFPADKGSEVREGDVLARLDDRDFRNDLAVAQAEMDRARAQYERVQKAAETDAVSQQDVSNARAAYDAARAQVSIKEKALQSTELRATFDGVVGTTFVDNFQTVQAKQAVLSLQDLSSIEVDINVPEQRMLTSRPERPRGNLFVVFDYLPDQRFPADLVTVAADADPVTQTYAATVGLERPVDVNILPGMSASVVVDLPAEALNGQGGIIIPVEAAAIDPSGQYYVWQLKDGEQGQYTVHRVDVQQGKLTDEGLVIEGGLASGDRIATAGVNFLEEGQRVKLLEPAS